MRKLRFSIALAWGLLSIAGDALAQTPSGGTVTGCQPDGTCWNPPPPPPKPPVCHQESGITVCNPG